MYRKTIKYGSFKLDLIYNDHRWDYLNQDSKIFFDVVASKAGEGKIYGVLYNDLKALRKYDQRYKEWTTEKFVSSLYKVFVILSAFNIKYIQR